MTPIYDKNLEILMLVPDRWGIARVDFQRNGPLYSFDANQEMRLAGISWDEPIDTKSVIPRVTVRLAHFNNQTYPILVEGFEHLINHPEVAAFPRARGVSHGHD